jgi:single-stranded-DNA-specific exonuclease
MLRDQRADDGVIVVVGEGWNEGVIGIVASKLMEKYRRPAFVLATRDDEAKGSGRSFGDFDLAAAIEATRQYLVRGGGHAAAGGVSLRRDQIEQWRLALQEFYTKLQLKDQARHLLPQEDIAKSELAELDVSLVQSLAKLEPFGMGNDNPVFRIVDVTAKYVDRIGSEKNHLKLTISDGDQQLKLLAFDPPEAWFVQPGDEIDLWANLEINEWQGRQSVEGRVLRLTVR